MSPPRTVTRSLRVPQEIDDQILQLQEKDDEPNLTQAYISLLEIGLKVVGYEKQLKENPTNAGQIKEEYDKLVQQMTEQILWKEAVASLPDDKLQLALIRGFKEYIERKRLRNIDNAQIGIWRTLRPA